MGRRERIAEIDDNGERNRYVYDARGERTVKLTKQGETVYVNQYYVVRNRSVVSKHLFAGTSRVVTHLVMGTAPGNEQRGAPGGYKTPGNGHGSDKTPTKPDGKDKANNEDKEHSNNGLHLGQLKNGNGKENPGQGRERRSETANAHAQDVVKNPTLTGEHPGQGSGSAKRAIDSDAPVVITEGEASVELNGDTAGGEVAVDGVSDTYTAPVVNGQSEFIWYYHPDHLGSTGFVTDQNGELYEHVEYFPFGETWVQEKSNTQRTPYLYTGKELDEETGLYYYGARYYDPRTSVWASADPILGRYLDGKPSGGIHNPFNLGLYAYSHQNPVNYLDPDGNSVFKAASIGYKVLFKGAKAADLVNDIVSDVKTLTSSESSGFEKAAAAFSLVSGIDSKYLKKAADKLGVGAKQAKTCSFAPGTLVLTKEGLKAIEEVKAGDYVLARDDQTGEQSWKRVVLAYNSLHDDALAVTLIDESGQEEEIVTTAEHPFYVDTAGWKRADQLETGDLIRTASGGWVKVGSATWLPTTQLAYNMEVADFHTYFVGNAQVWVHNQCDLHTPTRISNPKHHPNSISPEPKNVGELFKDAVADKNGVRWAKDSDGIVHRFSKPSNGETHWNGSTSGVDPIKPQNIPPEIKKLFGIKK